MTLCERVVVIHMGAGASSAASAKITAATNEELQSAIASMPEADRKRIRDAIEAENQPKPTGNDEPLSEAAAAKVTESWKLVSQDMEGHGIVFFKQIFTLAPEALQLFSFKDEPSERALLSFILIATLSPISLTTLISPPTQTSTRAKRSKPTPRRS